MHPWAPPTPGAGRLEIHGVSTARAAPVRDGSNANRKDDRFALFRPHPSSSASIRRRCPQPEDPRARAPMSRRPKPPQPLEGSVAQRKLEKVGALESVRNQPDRRSQAPGFPSALLCCRRQRRRQQTAKPKERESKANGVAAAKLSKKPRCHLSSFFFTEWVHPTRKRSTLYLTPRIYFWNDSLLERTCFGNFCVQLTASKMPPWEKTGPEYFI